MFEQLFGTKLQWEKQKQYIASSYYTFLGAIFLISYYLFTKGFIIMGSMATTDFTTTGNRLNHVGIVATSQDRLDHVEMVATSQDRLDHVEIVATIKDILDQVEMLASSQDRLNHVEIVATSQDISDQVAQIETRGSSSMMTEPLSNQK